jgi:hypothetical protein
MIGQHDPTVREDIQKFGCAFMSILVPRIHELGVDLDGPSLACYWDNLIAKGVISGDLNGDGVLGDTPDELCIQSFDAFCKALPELKLAFVTKCDDSVFFAPLLKLYANDPHYYGVTRWYNPNSKLSHYVHGFAKQVDWDPIEEGSETVKHGYPVGLRILRRV